MQGRPSSPDNKRNRVLLVLFVVIIGLVALFPVLSSLSQQWFEDRALESMISRIDESEIHRSTYELQNFSTRHYPSPENRRAASYLYDRLVAIPGLEVEYQSDRYQNVIASLPGTDNASDTVVIVGAHYDSKNRVSDQSNAPGAWDNGCGAAIVLELARVMSQYRFNHTVQFAFWNAEESGMDGSTEYVSDLSEHAVNIPLYLNYDGEGYDPENQYVLDIDYDEELNSTVELVSEYNSRYDIDFNLTFNAHNCSSDHVSFRRGGYPAIYLHSHPHSPYAHTQNDTVETLSFGYAKKDAQLGLVILGRTAEVQP